ncbi:hypothetical protein B0A49_06833 [Cryomyces minteri]|uniref:Transcription factor domain-containing protein n=1 Tax=Cryomyces minteri TaxID=331657 RepID=A0A4U0WM29_9PEZI|nr:hypothetical protein B0A49_09176 [Cryomyces minteri]TKA64659.1 hypothetical protein B0A49_06833 [Cryomyces minteri]
MSVGTTPIAGMPSNIEWSILTSQQELENESTNQGGIRALEQSATANFMTVLPAIQLSGHELVIFKMLVDPWSHWIDLFDPMKHFPTFVPHLPISLLPLMHNESLMKALLALFARYMSINRTGVDHQTLDSTAAVQYYYETLHYLQTAMEYQSYTRSLEIVVTASIVSTYEMIDGAGKGWERHLKEVFWTQRSQGIHGETGGMKQAVWWAWLRQDVWQAFREGRRHFSFFKPTKPYHLVTQYDFGSGLQLRRRNKGRGAQSTDEDNESRYATRNAGRMAAEPERTFRTFAR